MDLRETLVRPVSRYVSTDFVKVRPDDTVVEGARAMRDGEETEAVVCNRGSVIGIVTERDVVYKVVSEGLDPAKTRMRAIMSAPVETVQDTASVADAIAKMSKLGIRRLGVEGNGKFIGLIAQKNLVSGGLEVNVPLPELAEPKGRLRCPYCGAASLDSKALSKHIDHVHLGLGLLEGNRNKW